MHSLFIHPSFHQKYNTYFLLFIINIIIYSRDTFNLSIMEQNIVEKEFRKFYSVLTISCISNVSDVKNTTININIENITRDDS